MIINSVQNAIRVINCFKENDAELGILDIATSLGMNQSTVHHLVNSPCHDGVLAKTGSRKYRLGTQILYWGQLMSNHNRPLYRITPYLEELVKKTNESASLAILQNDKISYLTKIEPQRPLKIDTTVGTSFPLHYTAVGKLLLAYQNEKFIQKIISKPLIKNTIYTLTDKELLSCELKKIKKQGYAIEEEENEIGLYAIAAPIRNYLDHVVAAICITGPKDRLLKHQSDHIATVVKIAATVTNQCVL